MTVMDLPLLNSILNSLATICLISGFVFIKKGEIEKHKKSMVSAFFISGLFLISYLIYHYYVGSIPFTAHGWMRPVYFFILISHIILAIVIVPLVFITIFRGLKRMDEHHRKIARWTFPLWLYVSVTGVLVYLMNYIIWPSEHLQKLLN